jgi:hypothetical protein
MTPEERKRKIQEIKLLALVKQQQARLDALEARLAALEGE